mmetsp:Transcript_69068/g.225178  ORF Transcript_69068/g.225178 Transcript_69068/m.225178 type:complete len:433 (+) Transcript_69068:571-1869(+)
MSNRFINEMAWPVPSSLLKRAKVQSGSKSLIVSVLMRSTTCCLPSFTAIMLGYCNSKQRSMPCFTVSSNVGSTRLTPTGESRFSFSKPDQISWTEVNSTDSAVSVKLCWFSGLLMPSANQYNRWDSKPIKRNTCACSNVSRTPSNIRSSLFDVKSASGNESRIHWVVCRCTSSLLTRMGSETSSWNNSGTTKSRGPSRGQGQSSESSRPSLTMRSHANGRINLAFKRSSSFWCWSRSSPTEEVTSGSITAGLVALDWAPGSSFSPPARFKFASSKASPVEVTTVLANVALEPSRDRSNSRLPTAPALVSNVAPCDPETCFKSSSTFLPAATQLKTRVSGARTSIRVGLPYHCCNFGSSMDMKLWSIERLVFRGLIRNSLTMAEGRLPSTKLSSAQMPWIMHSSKGFSRMSAALLAGVAARPSFERYWVMYWS